MAMNNINQFSTGENGNGGRESGVTPFLMKAYEMVEEPSTNAIISWSPSGTSFIIWDHLKLCSELLPRYFKHGNLSSFIYQLNNYGFKKVGTRQWEFEHNWFQAGKKHLLPNIIRRRNKNLKVQKDCYQETYYRGVEAELRSQRDLNTTLISGIRKLKEKQDDLANGIASLKEYLENEDANFRKILCSLAKPLKQAAIQHTEEERSEVITKKRKVEDTSKVAKCATKP